MKSLPIDFPERARRSWTFRAAAVYLAGGWLLLQTAVWLRDAWGWPGWVVSGTFLFLALGFPVAVAAAWTRTGAWLEDEIRRALADAAGAQAGSGPLPPRDGHL